MTETPKKKKKWIQKIIPESHEGKFSSKAKAAGETTKEFAKEKEHSAGTLGKEARLAETLMGMKKRSPLYTHPRSK